MQLAVLLVLANIVIYATLAAPGIACLAYLKRVHPRRKHFATAMLLVTAAVFAPAYIGFGHLPVIVPFAASGFIDQYHHGLRRENVLMAALTMGVVLFARRRLLR